MEALIKGLPYNSGEALSLTVRTCVFNGDFHIETMLVKLVQDGQL